jgi:hypothetical protein
MQRRRIGNVVRGERPDVGAQGRIGSTPVRFLVDAQDDSASSRAASKLR